MDTDILEIRVRCGFYGIIPLVLLGGVLAALSSSVGAVIISVVTLLLVILLGFRPFLIVSSEDARYVSLISNRSSKVITHEELRHKLPGMKWFLRGSDFCRLSAYLGST